jgi:hypothetical protein
MQPLLALADANNFYVSCERVFRPNLIKELFREGYRYQKCGVQLGRSSRHRCRNSWTCSI